MKQFKKPVFKINKINDYSEPVFMACSGSTLFDFPGDGWTHQVPEDGRINFAEQTNGKYTGPAISRPVSTYAYITFNKPVNIVTWHDSFRSFKELGSSSADEPGTTNGSYTIVGVRDWGGLNHNEGIGLGALYVMTENGDMTDLHITNITMALSFNPSGCK